MALIVKDLVKKYGDKTVVNKLSFEMNKPGVYALLGTNGAGKTTIIQELKKENESLLAKVEKYEAEEKAIKVEAIIANVSKVFSADELSELREESKNYSLEELNVFDNLVKAKAFDRVGEVKTEKKFTKVAINDILDKPESKYLW